MNSKNFEIKSLGDIDFESIHKAFEQAFANYEIQLNETQLKTMLNRRGFCADLSFGAFEGDNIVSFTFNGIGVFNGVPTAYDTGTGTLRDYRGMGLATKIFEYSIPYLKGHNIKQYLLEVLQHNTKAVSVYRNLGFEVSREFNYFIQDVDKIQNVIKTSDINFSVREINIDDIELTTDFRDFYPSWQNSFESIKRALDDFVFFGAFEENKLIGYCAFEPNSGDIAQIAVDKNNRRREIGSLLIKKAVELNKSNIIKVINTDVRSVSITEFLNAKNIELKGKQFEMIKLL